MTEDIDNLVTILAVIIPTIGGALATKFIVNSWQDKKEKFNLKMAKFDLRKKIIKDFEDSYVLSHNLIEEIPVLVLRSHKDWLRKKIESGAHDVYLDQKFPDKLLPKNLFKKEIERVEKSIREATLSRWKLFNTVQIYFQGEEIYKELDKLSKQMADLDLLHNQIFHAQTPKDIQNFMKQFNPQYGELRNQLAIVTNLLINSKIRDISE